MKLHTQELAAQVFCKAADYIRKHGWQVSGMAVHGAPRCSMGALESAHEDIIWDKGLSSLMYKVLYQELRGESLTEFNHRVQDGETVALLFEHVAHTILKNIRVPQTNTESSVSIYN